MINHNYLKEDIHIKEEDKESLLGLVGKLNGSELKALLNDVLTPIGYNLIVTPNEIDYIISLLSHLLGQALNTIFSG